MNRWLFLLLSLIATTAFAGPFDGLGNLFKGEDSIPSAQQPTSEYSNSRNLNIVPVSAKAKRVALVIGNNSYPNLDPREQLYNAVNDARLMEMEFKALGFDVIKGENLGYREMKAAIRELEKNIEGGGTGAFFFAGHGVMHGRGNYLVPVDIPKLNDLATLQDEALEVNDLMVRLAESKARFSLLIIDACRNNPFKVEDKDGRTRTLGASRGMGLQKTPPEGMIVIYSAGVGQEAMDGPQGSNGLFTSEFVKELRKPGLHVAEVVQNVRDAVKQTAARAKREQTPAIYIQADKVYLNIGTMPSQAQAVPNVGVDTPAAPTGGSLDLEDLKKQGAIRKQWAKWQAGMKTEYEKVSGFEGDAELKAAAWELFLTSYTQKNPYSAEDEQLRLLAKQKRDQAQGDAGRQKEALERQKREAEAATLRAEEERQRQQAAAEAQRREQEAREAAERARQEAQRKADAELRPGKVFKDCTECPEMVVVPAGNFLMGSPQSEKERGSDEGPQHRVTIAQPFALGKTEVTQGQWKAVMGNNPSHFNTCGDGCPVEKVSWDDAQEFIKKLNTKTGQRYRLPSEAEWEYAARAGTTTPFHTGVCVNTRQANYDGNYDYANCGAKTGEYRNKPMPAGSFSPNGFGLYDMIGNVWEWVEDCYHDSYSGAPTDGSAWTSGGCSVRALRGGSWNGIPDFARSADRGGFGTSGRVSGGFRLARMLP